MDLSPKVFLSYAHDTDQHKAEVRALAVLLEGAGIAADLDQWRTAARQDWSSWAIGAMTAADYVVVVASPDYKRAGDGLGPGQVNRGVQSEAAVLRDLLHGDRPTWLPKLLPVLLPGHAVEEIPHFLQPHTADHYPIPALTPDGVERLVRVITAQPTRVRPPRGRIPRLPPLTD
ncbi:toll/interleukin-1 receptor domain-containing protein [Actinokineospora sp. NBRC 105648]|uniref:toll/interleukin-1 receptor domain-containing protein n=1 Tax=Actinokineospora sp. NBRC 105648 TaxID=3032206 RepID=UPI0024A3BFAD|nr:toll/interleukin-1 receptor domain-containing protein [Actinokineospora sp. NBRC 105648]GLZ40431.1 hypothetical protein Acsp05_40550 [Actinokineospora sp. NBRC 105648]